jgi:hypothetical protein
MGHQKPKSQPVFATSVLPPTTDIGHGDRQVRFVP